MFLYHCLDDFVVPQFDQDNCPPSSFLSCWCLYFSTMERRSELSVSSPRWLPTFLEHEAKKACFIFFVPHFPTLSLRLYQLYNFYLSCLCIHLYLSFRLPTYLPPCSPLSLSSYFLSSPFPSHSPVPASSFHSPANAVSLKNTRTLVHKWFTLSIHSLCTSQNDALLSKPHFHLFQHRLPPTLVCIMHVALKSWSALTSIQPQVNHAGGSDDVGAGHAKTGEDAFRSPSSTPNHHTWHSAPCLGQ